MMRDDATVVPSRRILQSAGTTDRDPRCDARVVNVRSQIPVSWIHGRSHRVMVQDLCHDALRRRMQGECQPAWLRIPQCVGVLPMGVYPHGAWVMVCRPHCPCLDSPVTRMSWCFTTYGMDVAWYDRYVTYYDRDVTTRDILVHYP